MALIREGPERALSSLPNWDGKQVCFFELPFKEISTQRDEATSLSVTSNKKEKSQQERKKWTKTESNESPEFLLCV